MFDFYRPVPELHCPDCATPLKDWQGLEGPCLLLVWQQGQIAPVAHQVVEESRLGREVLATLRLPDEFDIYTNCDQCGRWIAARGRCLNGGWSESEVIRPASGRPG